jgi:hypothetical protein
VKCIATHLEGFGHADVRDHELRGKVREHLADRFDRRFAVSADDRVRRMIVVADRRSFAQELRLKADAEIDARLLAARLLEDRLYLFLDRARLHRRSDHDGMELALVAQRGADLLRQSQDRGEVLAAVRGGRGTHANERDLGIRDRLARVVRDGDAAGVDDVGHELLDALLEDRGLAAADEVQFRGVDIDAGHAMPVAREARERHRADVSQAEDADAARLRGAVGNGSTFFFENGA